MVRARAEEFSPSELEGKKQVETEDPTTGDMVVIEEGNHFAGLDKPMKAFEDSLGKTALDKKGDLRKQFYQDLRRTAGERISSFCSRFRTLVGDMRREGVVLPDEELGWFLRSRMGLDAIRLQLLYPLRWVEKRSMRMWNQRRFDFSEIFTVRTLCINSNRNTTPFCSAS